MTITRETITFRRNAAYAPNTITFDQATAWYVRFHYKHLRQQGARPSTARSAIYNLAFQASMHPPVFTSGVSEAVAS